jgi:hypothetical protein
MAFRQFADSPELWKFGKSIILDPIDHFTDQIEFECADVRFVNFYYFDLVQLIF